MRKFQTSHEKVAPHIILSGNALDSTKAGGKREVRRLRVAADVESEDQVSQSDALSDDSDSTDKSVR